MTPRPTLANWLSDVLGTRNEFEDLRGSEERIRRAYAEMLGGYSVDTAAVLSVTRNVDIGDNGLVIQTEIPLFSMCRHHFLPFWGHLSIAYDPGDYIIGIGKLNRLADAISRRLQIQEDIVRQIGEELMASGRAKGVVVISVAKHLCICGRGPNGQSTETKATFNRGSLATPSDNLAAIQLLIDETNTKA